MLPQIFLKGKKLNIFVKCEMTHRWVKEKSESSKWKWFQNFVGWSSRIQCSLVRLTKLSEIERKVATNSENNKSAKRWKIEACHRTCFGRFRIPLTNRVRPNPDREPDPESAPEIVGRRNAFLLRLRKFWIRSCWTASSWARTRGAAPEVVTRAGQVNLKRIVIYSGGQTPSEMFSLKRLNKV